MTDELDKSRHTRPAPDEVCRRCKRRHDEDPTLNPGDIVVSLKYGEGTVRTVGRSDGQGCLEGSVRVHSSQEVVGWNGDGNWVLKADPLSADVAEWPTTQLLAVFVRIQERGRRQGLAWRAATSSQRKAFWQLLKDEIDLRIPRRARKDASDEPIPWEEPGSANADSRRP